jgi:protein tyrosine phosphatase (PTP) superfamily phosphohydrolase (DUF442 family)
VTSALRAPALLAGALLLVSAGACSPTTRARSAVPGPRSATAVEPRGLPNFAKVDEGLFRSGQPTREGLLEARRRGVRTVVCLRSEHGDRAALAGTGLAYVEIPMRAWSVDEEGVARFLRVATDPALRPVLVHCAHGCDRTGACVAAYRVAVQGWSPEQASEEMLRHGSVSLFRSCRCLPWRIDAPRLLARARALPPPRVERP